MSIQYVKSKHCSNIVRFSLHTAPKIYKYIYIFISKRVVYIMYVKEVEYFNQKDSPKPYIHIIHNTIWNVQSATGLKDPDPEQSIKL